MYFTYQNKACAHQQTLHLASQITRFILRHRQQDSFCVTDNKVHYERQATLQVCAKCKKIDFSSEQSAISKVHFVSQAWSPIESEATRSILCQFKKVHFVSQAWSPIESKATRSILCQRQNGPFCVRGSKVHFPSQTRTSSLWQRPKGNKVHFVSEATMSILSQRQQRPYCFTARSNENSRCPSRAQNTESELYFDAMYHALVVY